MSKYIKNIEIEDLFGYYSYSIGKNNLMGGEDPLLIIYGDNGCGKTTILELLFYLISTVDNVGYKSHIANIKFQKFSVKLDDDILVEAYRNTEELIGSYYLRIKDANGEEIHKVFLQVEEESNNIHMDDPKVNKKYQLFLNYIKQLNISIHYLSDKRKLLAGIDEIAYYSRSRVQQHMSRNEYERMRMEGVSGEEKDDLELSVKHLESWIRQHVLQASKVGDKNTNSIYTDLIKRVSSSTSKKITKEQVEVLVEKLVRIRKENMAYVKNGFVSHIDTKEIEKMLLASNQSNLSLIYNVLEPYVEGLRGRLDSLKDIQEVINLFISSINGYFSNKTIKYSMNRGFRITHDELQEPIELQMLSSGEKQLLLLFCHVITSSDEASIFIIDEPEISLNVKWQRKLIKTLLAFAYKKNVQFILASHSIEVLTGHKRSVCKLINNKKK